MKVSYLFKISVMFKKKWKKLALLEALTMLKQIPFVCCQNSMCVPPSIDSCSEEEKIINSGNFKLRSNLK